MKCKLKEPSNAVTLQLKHALSTSPDNFCCSQKKMYYPLYIKATLSINFCATVIVGCVGRTSQRQQQKIKQHVTNTILLEPISPDRSTLACSCKRFRSLKETFFSAIGQHLLLSPTCACEYSDNKFSILTRGHTSFHVSIFEATYIKTSKPNLCKQKEFMYALKITH